ncbi:hypothetical protein [Priestia megaterium]
MDTIQRFKELVFYFEKSLLRKLTYQEKEFLMWAVKKEKKEGTFKKCVD